MENQVEKLSNEDLKKLAMQAQEQAMMWKKKAYEEAGKISRISLLLECLKLQNGYIEFQDTLFTKDAVHTMSNELMSILYPPPQEDEKGVPVDEFFEEVPTL
jgi:hypothetical protein